MITYTETGKNNGYTQEAINEAAQAVKWEAFRREGLPYMQGAAIGEVIKSCKIPVNGIKKMFLHGNISREGTGLGFYGLEIVYKNGDVKIYIADSGCDICIVATDFMPNNKT